MKGPLSDHRHWSNNHSLTLEVLLDQHVLYRLHQQVSIMCTYWNHNREGYCQYYITLVKSAPKDFLWNIKWQRFVHGLQSPLKQCLQALCLIDFADDLNVGTTNWIGTLRPQLENQTRLNPFLVRVKMNRLERGSFSLLAFRSTTSLKGL